MSQQFDNLHFLLIPLMAEGHIIPLTEFGKLLAGHGVVVSIISTASHYTRYKPTINGAVKAGLKLQMIPVEFPELTQNAVTSVDLFAACEKLAAPLERLMAEMHPKPSCIVSSNALPWTQKLADGFKIPRYIFQTISCFTLLCSHMLTHETTAADWESFLVPGIPHRIKFTKAELARAYMAKSLDVKNTNSNNSIETAHGKMAKALHLARATLVNSFEEMEPAYAEGYREVARKLWCVGPVSLPKKNTDGGDKASIDEKHCISWLNEKEPGSVIYACFGSACRISEAQIKEIGLGLEASGFPFIWIIRGADASQEVEKWLEEEKFEERVEGRGLIIRGWAPQVLILSHPSVGGFLTHCGWNSTLEGLSAGVPMITWPMVADQLHNEKFIVQVLEIGLRIGVEVGAKKEALVKWGRVKKAVENLMREDDEGGERRRRAKKLAEMARETMEEGGSSSMNIKLFIQDVISCLE